MLDISKYREDILLLVLDTNQIELKNKRKIYRLMYLIQKDLEKVDKSIGYLFNEFLYGPFDSTLESNIGELYITAKAHTRSGAIALTDKGKYFFNYESEPKLKTLLGSEIYSNIKKQIRDYLSSSAADLSRTANELWLNEPRWTESRREEIKSLLGMG